jgi:AGZA family xanthine/uracil permease-like MFS transporter
MVLLLSLFGIISLMSAVIPLVAISPILLYIGMLIGAQAFQETPKAHAPAIILALTPHLAAWGKLLIDNSLGLAGTNAAAIGLDKLQGVGVLYHGLEIMGGGAILSGVILAATVACMADRKFMKASGFAAIGGVLTFFGLMHGEHIGVMQTPRVAFSYFLVAAVLVTVSKLATGTVPRLEHAEEPELELAPEGLPAVAKSM